MKRFVFAFVCIARIASADPVPVKVVEVAGDVAYVTPGRDAGVVAGATLIAGGRELKVVEASAQTAVVRVTGTPLRIGDTGTVDVTAASTWTTTKLAKPRPAEAFNGQWPDAVRPATQQHPKRVALGSGRAPTGSHITILGAAYATADRETRDGGAEARVIASFDLVQDRPLAADLDVAGRIGRPGHGFVRAAQLRYGDAIMVGRLRYAASTVGMLDGGRAAMRTGHIEIAAFGGLVPDPIDGRPDTGASRFGGEAIYDAADRAWQPRVAITAYGSTWNGAIDERRLALSTSASRASVRVDGWAELQAFPTTNEFDAKPLEVTGAGATAQWRKRGRHAGVDITFLRPERSRRLAAVLPLEWLCTPLHVRGDAATTCGGNESWTTANASAGLAAGRWIVDGIGSMTRTQAGFERSGYLRGAVRLGPVRTETAISAGKATFGSWTAGELGLAFAPSRWLDVDARYRAELLDYIASNGPMLMHSVIGDARFAQSPALDFDISAVATTGEDRDSVALFAIVAWRPLP
jgi:hypothetical protein